MLKLEHKHKGHTIREIGEGRLQVVNPYGDTASQLFHTFERALQYIDKHGKSTEELIPLVFKRKKSWKYANPQTGVFRDIKIGDQCVHFMPNKTVYETILEEGEPCAEEQKILFPDAPSLEYWRVSVFERERMPYSDLLGWLEVEVLNRCLPNKNQAKKFARKYCQATGVALARHLPANLIFLDELFAEEEEEEDAPAAVEDF